jgi:NAD(P)-dependent dehydrogenase (short-subunit alcohol dehydrogenase family)
MAQRCGSIEPVNRLENRRALVTGGTSGIGAATVTRLVAEGARVVFTGRDERRGADVAGRTGASFIRADVRDPTAIDASVDAAVALLGGLDIAVLNAGVLHDAPLSTTTDEAWDTVLDTNLVAPYRYACATLPHLVRGTSGAMTLTASDAGIWGETTIAAYSVSKRAVMMLTRMLAVEAGPQGVRVNCVCPGDTEPGMVTQVDGRDVLPDTSAWIRPPLGRLVHADHVAALVAFLASPEASTVNGADVLIDAGMRAALRANAAWAERGA